MADSIQLYSTAGGHRWILCTTRVRMLRCIDCGMLAPESAYFRAVESCTGERLLIVENQRLSAMLLSARHGLQELLRRVDTVLGREGES